jgi:Fe-S-cluster containining protein
MDERFEEITDFDPVGQDYPLGDQGYACFRCGDCCGLWVFVTYEEADRIAERVKMPRSEFTIEYWDRSVSPEECLVLQQKDDACVFLREKPENHETYCGIYELRPRVCRDFIPTLKRKSCREGLLKHWNLTVSPMGRPEGSDDHINDFYDYLKKMVQDR